MLDEGTTDYTIHIEKVLSVALKYGNHVFGSDWVLQWDSTRPRSHRLTQQ